MIIAVSATAPSLAAQLDPRFGRCAFLLFIETDDLKMEALENPNVALGGGAGIQTAQLVAGKGAKAILTGFCGPNAYQVLAAAGIQVTTECQGQVAEVVERYKQGQLQAVSQPNAASHAGMAPGTPGPGGQGGQKLSPGGGSGFGGGGLGGGGLGGGGLGGGRGGGGGGGGGRGRGGGGGRCSGGRGRGGMGFAGGAAGGALQGTQEVPAADDPSLPLTLGQAFASHRLSVDPKLGYNPRPLPHKLPVPQVDEARCSGCGLCLQLCPTNAVSLEEVARIDPERCISCLQCLAGCPEEAIRLDADS